MAPTSFFSPEELADLGLASIGVEVRVSRYARLYAPQSIVLGDEVRIDDFAVLSPGDYKIELRGHNHVAVGAMVFGPVVIGEWSTVSGRVAIYGLSDDFTKLGVTYPHADPDQRRLITAEVSIGRNVVIGTGSTVLPGVRIADDVAVGAMSLVAATIDVAGLYAGIPVRRLGDRKPP